MKRFQVIQVDGGGCDIEQSYLTADSIEQVLDGLLKMIVIHKDTKGVHILDIGAVE